MSTLNAIPDSQSIFGLTSDPPDVRKSDPTASNPRQTDPNQVLDENGLTKNDRDNLMSIRRLYMERWSMPRRILVRNILRKMEYFKNNQYYVVGPDGFTFQDPFADSESSQGSTQQGGESADYYRYVTNIIQWFEKILRSTLSASIPAIRFQPSNAQSDIGNRVADNASHANAYIERLNDEKSLLEQKITYLALAGSYFVYARPVRDEKLSGGRMEAKTTEEMQTRQVRDNGYYCSNCGQHTSQDQMAVESGLNCKFCGQPVSDADFFPSMSLPMPVVTAAQDVPQVQVRKSIYNGLHVACAHNAESDSGDPVTKTPYLDLSLEVDIGALRAMYPKMWSELAGGGDASGSGDNEVDRQSRMQQFTQNNGAAWWTRSSGMLTQGQMPTYSRTWLQPEAFNSLDLEADAKRLKDKFPDGCCMASFGGQFLDIRPAKMAEEWTSGLTTRGFGIYPPAILDPAMDFQDRLNDAGNTESEYYDRMAVPGIAYDSKAITGRGLNGKYWAVGSWFPVAVKPKDGRKLSDILFQPTYHMDAGIKDYQQRLVLMAQMVVGVTPQTYGGSQPDIKTATGQAQALKVANGILWGYWSQIRSESARTALNAVRCLANNATEEVFDVIKGDDDKFKNEPIDLNSLKNEIEAYPEEEQGFPESRDQMADRFEKLLTSPNNDLTMEMLQPMKNRRIVMRTMLPQDMVMPQQDERIKVLEDIERLMQGVPTQAIDPATMQPTMVPSVMPDQKLKNILAVTEEVVSEYVTKNYWQLKEQTPQQFDNIMAYLTMASEFNTRNQIAAMPPPGAAPGGKPPGPPQQAAA